MKARSFGDLPVEAQARIAAAPAELREFLVATWPDDEQDAQAKRDDAERALQKQLDEREALEDLADAAEAGDYGPAGKLLTQRIFATGGRCPHNLRALQDALRQLSPRARRRRPAADPVPAGRVAAGGMRR